MKPILIVMSGISGSGKSTFSNGLKTSMNATVVSTDDIRLELTGNAEDQTQNGRVFGVAKKRINDLLAQGKNAVIDATSLSAKDRKDWVQIGKLNGAKIIAYVVKVPIDVAKKRNNGRDRKVPEWVIDKQSAKFTIPSASEGFDEIVVKS
jgi:predicted kinase